jgi:hypothetical protein
MPISQQSTNMLYLTFRQWFLLARLHLNTVLEQDNEEGVLRVLDNLPKEIDGIYDEAMERVERQPTTKELSKRVLSWIIYASRPLSVEELQHALAVSPKMTQTRSFLRMETSVCAGLVVIDKELASALYNSRIEIRVTMTQLVKMPALKKVDKLFCLCVSSVEISLQLLLTFHLPKARHHGVSGISHGSLTFHSPLSPVTSQ